MTPNHEIAVEVAVHHARAFIRSQNPRHLDVIEDLNQRVNSPAIFVTDTVKRLGRHNALAIGFDAKLVSNCIRLAKERATCSSTAAP
jgi:uncharacterized protein (UPF0335 family)